MRISYNWLKAHIELHESPEEVSKLLTSSGLEVEHLEEVSSVKGGLNGLVIARVIEKWKHPKADRLSLTRVDPGNGNIVQVVCGAPNVEAGQVVVFAPVGTMVHPLKGEPFLIGDAVIRGEKSSGMICAEDEIGLGDSHDGIMVLPDDAPLGMAAAEYFGVETDYVFEIGLTPNRGDAASHLGVARELAALTGRPLLKNHPGSELPVAGSSSSEIKIVDEENGIRYCGAKIRNIQVAESPDWLKKRLLAIGLNPINNVVDITNFVLHDLGQPIHAFDLSKLNLPLEVRKAREGEILNTLDGTERKLRGTELIIADQRAALALAGVFGGKDSGVTSATADLFIESACFHPSAVRKTAREHSLNTDSSFRFERGTDPEMPMNALRKTVSLILEICGGTLDGKLFDDYPNPAGMREVTLRISKLNSVAGTELPAGEVKLILTSLQFRILAEKGDQWLISVPSFRTDVQQEIDIIEEILRIYGYDKIPFAPRISMSASGLPRNPLVSAERRIRSYLNAIGFSEMMSNSLNASSWYPEAEQAQLVRLSNPLSAEMDVLRSTICWNALQSVAFNINYRNRNVRLFETGKVYAKGKNGITETEMLMLVSTGAQHEETWEAKAPDAGYYHLKAVLQGLTVLFGSDASKVFPAIRRVSPAEKAVFGIEQEVYCAELPLRDLLGQSAAFSLKPAPRFPVVKRDLSLVLDRHIPYSEIDRVISSRKQPLISQSRVFDVFEGKPLEAGKKSVSVSFFLYDDTKTLTDAETDAIMNDLLTAFEQELGAIIRK